MSDAPWPPTRIAEDLRGLGVTSGMNVFVHASLRAVGPVEGGADGVIDAIRLAIGDAGTMVMVLGARDEWAWVNGRPEPERVALLADAEPFDFRMTPADPEVGVLAEVFRQRPETQVNDHPEARFSAAGPAADRYLCDAAWDDYFGAESPVERFIADGGRVLRLGADLNTVTVLHHAEWRCSVSPKRRIRRHRRVRTAEGPRIVVVETFDDDQGIVDYGAGDDYFEDLLRDYLATGRATQGRVGHAHSELLDAADIVAFGVRWMEEHLRP